MEQEHIVVKEQGKEYIVSKDENGNFPVYINIPVMPNSNELAIAPNKPSCYCNIGVDVTVLKLGQYLGQNGLYYAYE